MNPKTLQELLEITERHGIYERILNQFKDINKLKYCYYKEVKISEGIIPIIIIAKNLDIAKVKYVKIFTAAQHNEYNGLFGILEFIQKIKEHELKIEDILEKNQIIIFLPLLNPFGFLNPNKSNKSGYYLKNGTNLNRYWGKTFVPEFDKKDDDSNEKVIPEQVIIVKNILNEYWNKEEIAIYIMDFHETSLLHRYILDLSEHLHDQLFTYKFTHWLKEKIILNIIKLHEIKYLHEPLFFKCTPSANHTHINLTIKQLDIVYEKLLEYIVKNNSKLPFYFCYGEKSKDYCQCLAQIVYNKLRGKLWETRFPAYNHKFQDHGCFVNMGDATKRKKVYTMELESQKQFFDIFDEIEKSKIEPKYFKIKLNLINVSIELVIETIKEMIKLH
jgi:hypothetical protein